MLGKEVRISRVGNGVLLEPIATDWTAVFAGIDSYGPFEIERNQLLPPESENLVD